MKKSSNKDEVKENDAEDEDLDESDTENEDDNDIKSIDTSDFKPGIAFTLIKQFYIKYAKYVLIINFKNIKGYKIIKKHVISLRYDCILASGINMSRKLDFQ